MVAHKTPLSQQRTDEVHHHDSPLDHIWPIGGYPVTHSEVEAIAEEAANKALEKFFLTLGVDVTDPKEVIQIQDDLRFLGHWRESTEAVKRKATMTAVGVVVTGALGWLGLMIYHK